MTSLLLIYLDRLRIIFLSFLKQGLVTLDYKYLLSQTTRVSIQVQILNTEHIFHFYYSDGEFCVVECVDVGQEVGMTVRELIGLGNL